jgi:hypothetical protein
VLLVLILILAMRFEITKHEERRLPSSSTLYHTVSKVESYNETLGFVHLVESAAPAWEIALTDSLSKDELRKL